jgi:hypothetical protein
MIIYSAQYVPRGSIVVLDGFYSVKRLLRLYRVLGLVVITRMRSNSVAYAPFSFGPAVKGRGRPRTRGSKISLASVFAEVDIFEKATLTLYGRPTLVRYRCWELHWDTPYELVQVVWT